MVSTVLPQSGTLLRKQLDGHEVLSCGGWSSCLDCGEWDGINTKYFLQLSQNTPLKQVLVKWAVWPGLVLFMLGQAH